MLRDYPSSWRSADSFPQSLGLLTDYQNSSEHVPNITATASTPQGQREQRWGFLDTLQCSAPLVRRHEPVYFWGAKRGPMSHILQRLGLAKHGEVSMTGHLMCMDQRNPGSDRCPLCLLVESESQLRSLRLSQLKKPFLFTLCS